MRSPIAALSAHITANADATWARFYDPIPSMSTGLSVPLTGVMLLIWQIRDADLQQLFDLETEKSRREFLAWCVIHGRREYKALAESQELWSALTAPLSLPSTETTEFDASYAMNPLLILIGDARPDLGFNLKEEIGRRQLLTWFVLHGRTELSLDDIPYTAEQLDFFSSNSQIPILNSLQHIIYSCRADLQHAFPLPSQTARYLNWYNTNVSLEVRSGSAEHHFSFGRPTRSGVNIIGYARGTFGIAEDCRMATRAFIDAGIESGLYDFPPGPAAPLGDTSMDAHIMESLPFNVNVFCLTALEHARFFLSRGAEALKERMNIGYWPWELERWPQEWNHLFILVDEVWSSSTYTRDAIRNATPKTTRLMPMAVEVPISAPRNRKYFGLPENCYLFFFAFDLNSSMSRKNPAACINAFLDAFPDTEKNESNVALVIKCYPPKEITAEWEALKDLSRRDPRILIIEANLAKNDLLSLYRCCDCFVTLHRAEGFGRSIAEAMLLEKLVISTNYSGNLDFTTSDTSLLVNFRYQAIQKEQYPSSTGQSWAAPLLERAVMAMRRAVSPDQAILTLASTGRKLIEEKYSISAVGANYRKALFPGQ